MAETTPNLGLNVWNLATDHFNHLELEENWEELDAAVLDKRGDTATGAITFQAAGGTIPVAGTKVTGDTEHRLLIQANGAISLGSGSDVDYLTMTRVTLAALHGVNDQAFSFNGIVSLASGGWLDLNQSSGTVLQNFINGVHTNPTFRIEADGDIRWGPGTSALEGTLSYTSGTLTFAATGAGFIKATGFKSTRTATLGAFENFLLDADANPAIRLRGDGKIQWGAGGASATDTSLARSASNQLTLENSGTLIAGTIQASNSMSVGGTAVARDSQGLRSGRATAGVIGRYYWATDEEVLYRDNGTAWKPLTPIVVNDQTELPTSPTDGQVAHLMGAGDEEGYTLIYNSGSDWWNVVGGPPLMVENFAYLVAPIVWSNSEVYTDSDVDSLSVPFTGKVRVTLETQVLLMASASSASRFFYLSYSGTNGVSNSEGTKDARGAVIGLAVGGSESFTRRVSEITLAASSTFTMQHRVPSEGQVQLGPRRMIVEPITLAS